MVPIVQTAQTVESPQLQVHPGCRHLFRGCRGSLSRSRLSSDHSCTRWSTSLFPSCRSLPRRGAEGCFLWSRLLVGPFRLRSLQHASDGRCPCCAVPQFSSADVEETGCAPTVALVFLRGHCRAHSRRCVTTDAGWFRRHSCCDVAEVDQLMSLMS